jgi:hypothetical protein
MSIYSEQIGFAAGVLIGQRTDITVTTPRRFGILQDVTLDITADLKELYGQKRYAIALAPGKTKVELKAKFAGIRGNLFNDLFFGETATASQTQYVDNELATVPGSSTYTVAASNHAAFLNDEGVFYQNTGLPLSVVSVLSAAGQYEISNTGTYTFDSLDASAGVGLSYTYSTAGGVQISIANLAMGTGPIFKVMLSESFDGRQGNWIFNSCQCSKLSLPTKQDDFEIYELDFMVSADGSGNIGTANFAL